MKLTVHFSDNDIEFMKKLMRKQKEKAIEENNKQDAKKFDKALKRLEEMKDDKKLEKII